MRASRPSRCQCQRQFRRVSDDADAVRGPGRREPNGRKLAELADDPIVKAQRFMNGSTRGGGFLRSVGGGRWAAVVVVLVAWFGGDCVTLGAAPLPADVAAKIDRVFARWDKPDTPGAIVGIGRHGETVYARGFGLANLEHGIPLAPETRSESGSVAKQFTAAAVTTLAVRGKLSLDDSIKRHLPELPEICRGMTLRMLLDHTSGLRDIHGLFDLMGRPTYTAAHENAEVLEVVSRQRELNFPSGAEYSYSNTGYLLLTFVVERVSGQRFSEFCRTQVFEPRGLHHTAWRTDFTAIVPGRASAYAQARDGTFRVDVPYSNIHGNGGMLTTVGDLLRWNASFEQAEGEWAEVIRLMQTPSRLKTGEPIENGLGLRLESYRGVAEVSHSGGTAGYSTFLARYPAQGWSIVVLGNSLGLDAAVHVRRMADILLAGELTPVVRPVPVAISAAKLATYAGLYRHVGHDLLVRVVGVEGGLLVNGIHVVPTADGVFTATGTGAKYAFASAKDGAPARLTFTANRIARTYEAVDTASPTPARLAVYAGDYHSPELGVTVPVVMRDGALAVRIHPLPAVRAEPTFADGFWLTGRGWHITFTRESDGTVTGFEATNTLGRCRRVKFVRR